MSLSVLTKILHRDTDPDAVPGKDLCRQPQNTTKETKPESSPKTKNGPETTESNYTQPPKDGETRIKQKSPETSGHAGLDCGVTLVKSSPSSAVSTVENGITLASTSTTSVRKQWELPKSSVNDESTKKSQDASFYAPIATGKDTTPIVSLPQALDAISAFLLKYIRFPEEWHVTTVALWAAYAWVWRAFYCTPYLLVRGPEQNCGKTLVLQCLLALCPNVLGRALIASISEAALFRSVNADKPILLIDEVDKFFARGTEDPIVGILNAGYKHGAVCIRCVGQSKSPEMFNVYCPKAFAGIGDMVDNTTASRAIHIHMARQNPDDRAAIFREEEIAMEVAGIRTFLGVWAEQATEALRRVRPIVPEEIKDGRQISIVEPLLAVADMAQGDWPDKAREAAVYAFQQPTEDSEGTQLLRSIRAVFETRNTERITSYDLIGDLIKLEDSDAPWSGWWERDYSKGNWHGAAGRIARMLKLYGIQPKNIRAGDDGEVHKGYVSGDFAKVFRRYLAQEVVRQQAEMKL
jgi:hypothetical protein